MASVFISYSSHDREIAGRLAADLKGRGHRIWIDESEVRGGDEISEKIEEGLEWASHLLVLLSAASVESRWVSAEWRAALKRELDGGAIQVIGLLLDDVEVRTMLASRKSIDFRGDYEAGLSDLASALEEVARPRKQKQLKVWYLDDSRDWLEKFERKHGQQFQVTTFNNMMHFLEGLRSSRPGAPDFPDIALVDLYSPKSDFEVDRALLQKTKKEMKQFFDMEQSLRGLVDAAWRPRGVEVVEWVREHYEPEELPVAIHTQRGLVLLKDKLIRELEERRVDWILKNRFSPRTDQVMMNRMMMRSTRPPRARTTPRVLVIDDNQLFLEEFCQRHRGCYEIETITDESKVLATLQQLQHEERFPHLFLVDLYYPRSDGPEAQDKIDLANRALDDFAAFESRLQELVGETFEPIGLEVVRRVRAMYSPVELPILVYTQGGLLMLDDDGIHQIEELEAGWLLKERYGVATEEAKIFGQVTRARSRPVGAV